MAEDIKEYRRRYYQEHREEKRKYGREYHRVHREEDENRRRKNYRRRKDEALLLLGNECLVCREGHEKKLRFHKKDGVRHKTPGYLLVLRNPDDFVLLCFSCHRWVHLTMKFFGMSWERIYALLVNKFKKE